jgi:hypothetical protein
MQMVFSDNYVDGKGKLKTTKGFDGFGSFVGRVRSTKKDEYALNFAADAMTLVALFQKVRPQKRKLRTQQQATIAWHEVSIALLHI